MARRLALLASLLTALPAAAVPGDRLWTSDDVERFLAWTETHTR